jgi:hypothetical protein
LALQRSPICVFSALPKPLQQRFKTFEVSVAEIVQADNDEVTNLFSRLRFATDTTISGHQIYIRFGR